MMLAARIVFLLFLSAPVFAQDVSFEAAVNATKVTSNDAVQLTLTVFGGKDVPVVDVAAIDGFDVRYLGPSTSVAIVNGNYSSQRSFIYNLFPTKTGNFKVPSFSITLNGQEYSTKPIDIEVLAAAAPAASSPTTGGTPQNAEEDLKDRLFAVVGVPAEAVYVGQKVPVTVKLFVRDTPIREIQFPTFTSSTGVTVEDFTAKPLQYKQVLNGFSYDVVEFKTFVYLSLQGKVEVGPASIQGNLIYRNPNQPNPLHGFNDDFFDGFFKNISVQARPVTITTAKEHLNVLPLPAEGIPNGFTGAVGSFDFDVSVSPDKVQVGDPLTLRMKISGDGNLKKAGFPNFDDEHFKIYDPKIKDESDGKSLEQVIIPSSTGITEVQPLAFSFFDPAAREYKTITRGPFALQVTPAAGGEFKAVGFDLTKLPSSEAETKPMPQLDWSGYAQKSLSVAEKVFKSILFWSIIIGMGVVVLGVMLWRNFRRRLKDDTRFSRRFHALRKAQQTLTEAEAQLNAGQGKEFYSVLYRALNTYLADKMHQPSGTSVLNNAQDLLIQKKVGAEDIGILKGIYEACDLFRFAGAIPEAGRMRTHLAQARKIIAVLEKKL